MLVTLPSSVLICFPATVLCYCNLTKEAFKLVSHPCSRIYSDPNALKYHDTIMNNTCFVLYHDSEIINSHCNGADQTNKMPRIWTVTKRHFPINLCSDSVKGH